MALILGAVKQDGHMFWDEYSHQLNSNGCLIVPARYRKWQQALDGVSTKLAESKSWLNFSL